MTSLLATNLFPFADGGAGHVCSLGTAPAVGDVDFLCVNSDTTVSTPSGFTLALSSVVSQGSYLFYRKAVGGESDSVTITTSGSHNCQVSHSRWSGLNAVDKAVVTNTVGSGGISSHPVDSGTLTATGEFVLMFAALHSVGTGTAAHTPVWSSGYTAVTGPNQQGTGATGVTAFVGWKDNAGTAAETPSVSWSGNSIFDRDSYVITFTSATTPVTSDVDLRWAVENQVDSDLDLRWRVSSVVTSDLDLRWPVENEITSDLDLRWEVAQATGTVVSDTDLRWRVSSVVTSDSDLRWIILAVGHDVVVLSALAEQGRITVTLGEHNG